MTVSYPELRPHGQASNGQIWVPPPQQNFVPYHVDSNTSILEYNRRPIVGSEIRWWGGGSGNRGLEEWESCTC